MENIKYVLKWKDQLFHNEEKFVGSMSSHVALQYAIQWDTKKEVKIRMEKNLNLKDKCEICEVKIISDETNIS